MFILTSPAITVITTGTDWPAIVAGISTGIVGIAGILGTVWQGKRAGDAEKENFIRSEKVKAYATMQRILGDIILAAVNVRSAYEVTDSSSNRREEVNNKFDEVRAAALQSLSVVRIIGNEKVSSSASNLVSKLLKYASDSQTDNPDYDDSADLDEITKLRAGLQEEMRLDLGTSKTTK